MVMSAPSTEVGPGWWAFVAFFFLAIALWLIMRSMFTRLRRMNLAQKDELRRQQEEARARDDLAERARDLDLPEGSGGSAGLRRDGPEEGQGRRDEV
ncbi:MAG: hypothetical protein C0493_00240 [Kytococcus sp.]|nr:hypothetical protein [Kytococcus sp.]